MSAVSYEVLQTTGKIYTADHAMCFSGLLGPASIGTDVPHTWEWVKFHPKLDMVKNDLPELLGMESIGDVATWWITQVESWGIEMPMSDVSPAAIWENGLVVQYNKVRSQILRPLTVMRYISEIPEVLHTMLLLGKWYQDVFTGSPDKTWAAFCVSHRGGLVEPWVNNGGVNTNHALLGSQGELHHFPDGGVVISETVPGLFDSMPAVIQDAPKIRNGYRLRDKNEYLNDVVLYLRNKSNDKSKQSVA